MVGIERDADRARHRRLAAVHPARLADRGLQPLGEDRRVLGARVGADQQQVLVAAEVGDAVFGAREALQARRDLAQHEVAGGVAERLVDRLEAVEVDEQDREPLVGAVGLLHRLGEHAVEHQPVRQAGQAVAEAAPLQLGLGPAQRPAQARLERPRTAGRRIRIAHEPTEASRTSVAEVSRSAWGEPVCSARPAAPRTSCWLATRLMPKTSAAVACQPSVAGWVRSPPRKNAPSAIMQPPAGAGERGDQRQELPVDPGHQAERREREGVRADGADAERDTRRSRPGRASRRGR